jgi:hypothetical protein
MPLEDFKSAYPEAQLVADAKGPQGVPFSIYQSKPEGKIKSANYFFSENKLVGIIVLYSEGVQFDPVVDDLTALNGKATNQVMMADSKAAVWERGPYFINMIQSASETEIKLPTGASRVLQPGDIVVMLGRKSR